VGVTKGLQEADPTPPTRQAKSLTPEKSIARQAKSITPEKGMGYSGRATQLPVSRMIE
jgi:hypothetical protein